MTEKINELQQVEYKDDLILTTEQLAEFYGTTTNNIKKNFQRSKDRFIEGKHYYFLKGASLKAFKDSVSSSDLVGKHAPSLFLWTKR